MIKLFLCIVILVSCGLAGQLRARKYDNRVYHIQDYITTIRILESEMSYRLDPLTEILNRIGTQNGNMAGKLLITARNLLEESNYGEFSLCWKEATKQTYEGSSLSKVDIQVIADFGMELGKTDMDNQRSLFYRSCTLMESQLAEAMEEKKTKGKMYKSLGAAIGAFIVIILV